MGSDWSVSTRRPADRDGGRGQPLFASPAASAAFLPDERLTSIEAIPASRPGSAYVNHLDDDTGSIEVGKLADLAVLDRDLFDRGAGPIGDARVVATFIDGAAVFEDPARRLTRAVRRPRMAAPAPRMDA